MSHAKSKTAWDKRCHRCGRCCYEKIEHEGRIFYTDVPCEFLDLQTRLCTVFFDRHLKKPECMPLTDETLEQGILPHDCPYVSNFENYKAPQLIDED